MDEKKAIYSVCNDIWGLIKKYGCAELTDEQWETFCGQGEELLKKYREYGPEVETLYRDLFRAVQEYYVRKKGGKSSEE